MGDSAESQERQYPTAGWDHLLQVGAQCLRALLFHEWCYIRALHEWILPIHFGSKGWQQWGIPCQPHLPEGFFALQFLDAGIESRWSPATWGFLFLGWLLFALGFPNTLRQKLICFLHGRPRSTLDAQTMCAKPSESWISPSSLCRSLRHSLKSLKNAKNLNCFSNSPWGQEKSTNGEKYDLIWQALNCDWFIFCGATWPCPELQQKEICLAIRELLKMCLFLSA